MKSSLTVLSFVSFLAVHSAAGHAQLREMKHFVVPAAVVARAITTTFAGRGVRVDAEQVALPASVFSAVADPTLQVGAVQALGPLDMAHPDQVSASIRMRCKTSAMCLPFYAVVTWQASQDALVTPRASAVKLLAASTSSDQAAPSAIKSGGHATLLLEADHARIQIEVISLGSAALGAQVRVASTDRKHTYTGEVIGTNLVRARF